MLVVLNVTSVSKDSLVGKDPSLLVGKDPSLILGPLSANTDIISGIVDNTTGKNTATMRNIHGPLLRRASSIVHLNTEDPSRQTSFHLSRISIIYLFCGFRDITIAVKA